MYTICVYAQSCMTLCDSVARLLCPCNFPGKSTGMGCHFLLQGIFLIQGSNSRLLHWQADSFFFFFLAGWFFITAPPGKPNKWQNSTEKPVYFIQINRSQLHGTEWTDEYGLQLYDFVETILTLIFVSQKNLFSYAMTYNKLIKYTSVNKQMKK